MGVGSSPRIEMAIGVALVVVLVVGLIIWAVATPRCVCPCATCTRVRNTGKDQFSPFSIQSVPTIITGPSGQTYGKRAGGTCFENHSTFKNGPWTTRDAALSACQLSSMCGAVQCSKGKCRACTAGDFDEAGVSGSFLYVPTHG